MPFYRPERRLTSRLAGTHSRSRSFNISRSGNLRKISRYPFTRTAKKLLFNVFNIFFTSRKPPGTISFVRIQTDTDTHIYTYTRTHIHTYIRTHARTRALTNRDPSFTCFCTNLGDCLAYTMYHMYLPRRKKPSRHHPLSYIISRCRMAIWWFASC
jgi:hypothetical protein